MYQVLFSDAYGLQTRFAIDNFNVGNEAHAVQNKTRLKLLQVSRYLKTLWSTVL